MHAEPLQEHQWLQKLVGEWTYEGDCSGPSGEPAPKTTGTESVRSLGGLWVLAEGQGQMGGDAATMLMSLGYDPAQGKYVGTWMGSMMTKMWVYNGTLDADGKVLTLDTEGPSWTEEGKTARYQDIIEFLDEDHRTLSSQAQGADGNWTRFMTTHYYRVK